MKNEAQGVWVYSQLLKKPFATLDELKEAEEVYNKEHAAELKIKEDRKVEAEKVKTFIKARMEAVATANRAKTEAYKAYLVALDTAEQSVNVAARREQEALVAFCKKYPEGFHDTVQIGDVTYKYSYNTTLPETPLDSFIRLFTR